MPAKKLEPEEAKKLLAVWEGINRTTKTYTSLIAKFMAHLTTTYNLDNDEWSERLHDWYMTTRDHGSMSFAGRIESWLKESAHPILESSYNIIDKK
jgi:hypothetical protein